MKKNRNIAALLFSTILILAMAMSIIVTPNAGQIYPPAGTLIPTYAFLNVAPNPVGVGQDVTINFFLATPMETSERPTGMTVVQMNPDGTNTTLGPFTGDTTGGSYTMFNPPSVGNWTFQFFYAGQTLTGTSGWSGLVNEPSMSAPVTLVVQEEPVGLGSAYPITPLPNAWWETPVTAQNVQEWYKITGPWLGFGSISFGATGSYNQTSFCNPYTPSVLSGHILWTKVWASSGGVVGGDAGGTQDTGHYWSTRQYQPQYAPVIISGVMYSQQFDVSMGTNMGSGIQAVNLYTGETLYTINTTNPLRCGMTTNYGQINQYGVIGPFIWTTGTLPAADTGGTRINQQAGSTQWNMYNALNGNYLLSVVNGSAMTLRPDESGNLIGYFINNTAGTEIVHPGPGQSEVVTTTGPHLSMVNMTMAIGQTGGSWQPARNTVRSIDTGIMWTVQLPNNISDVPIGPALSINAVVGNAVIMTSGTVHGQGLGGETAGWMVFCSIDADTGKELWTKNFTYADGWTSYLPYTRTSTAYGEGKIFNMNDVNYAIEAIDVRTGQKSWTSKFTGDAGADPNPYDLFSLKPYVANGNLITAGLGGDLWCHNATNGDLIWYTNTTKLIGDPGIETPYGIWPFWVFNCAGFTNDVAYMPIGHEYNPPLFHGAQMLAVNMTDGSLVWSELGTYTRSTSIAQGVMLSMNAYDNLIYAFGKGPSQITISAPQIGVTTNTPITITGRVTDIAEGSKRHDVAANFPNGVPCVSDESQSKWMEHVYQQQQRPYDVTGVDVTLSVVDGNGNYRTIGTTKTTDGEYSFVWVPDISGTYRVTATFEGSNSYYKSDATTYFHASDDSSVLPPPSNDQPTNYATTTDMIVGVVAIIIAIVIVGLLILRKK